MSKKCRNPVPNLRVRGLGKPFLAIPADLPIYEEMPDPFQVLKAELSDPLFPKNANFVIFDESRGPATVPKLWRFRVRRRPTNPIIYIKQECLITF